MTGTANSESILGGHCILQSTDEENQDPQRSKASSSSPNELMAEWGSSPLSQKIRTLSTITLRRWSICLQCRRPWFNPWVRKISWRRKWHPTPGSWQAAGHGVTESRTQLSDFRFTSVFHCMHTPHLLHPLSCWWTLRLFPCLGCCQ